MMSPGADLLARKDCTADFVALSISMKGKVGSEGSGEVVGAVGRRQRSLTR